MQNIKVKGLVNVYGMKFHDIEGGFGEGKKAMLTKEIANIHGRDTGKINELINNSRKRFIDGLDIVDLKGTEFVILLKDNEIYTQNALNKSKNIYLLSERGYSKLLKILDDDFAWEQYDKLVDGYFQMREQLTNNQLTAEQITALIQNTVKQEVSDFKKEVEDDVTRLEGLIGIRSKTVFDYSRYIKLRLGISRVNNDYRAVQLVLFHEFHVTKWEELTYSKDVITRIDQLCCEYNARSRKYNKLW